VHPLIGIDGDQRRAADLLPCLHHTPPVHYVVEQGAAPFGVGRPRRRDQVGGVTLGRDGCRLAVLHGASRSEASIPSLMSSVMRCNWATSAAE
jgi:hypothetical protein